MGSSASTSAGRRRAATRSRGARRRSTGAARPAARGSTRSAASRSGRRRWARRAAVLVALAAAIGAGYLLWLRDSSLVAVTEVTVEGIEATDAGPIARALRREARTMTTLHVDRDRLDAVAARFPAVEAVSADASFPRSLTIEVVERPPAAVARAGEDEVALAADGTVLRGVQAGGGLPRVDVDRVPKAGRLHGEARSRALVAAAAPEPLGRLIRRVRSSSELGIEVRMRGGMTLRFGTDSNAPAKWAAAAAVLADPRLESASHIDVRVPQRPAVGGAGLPEG